ncbi:hypothetical protein LCGC14_0220200 [marine sediment metagenome]|uniref:Uncharacterized protein n=1 Tax=marine sediment metagenome TaxID=412755 RepID=A0A0F9UD91_9ZZZZ
MSSALRGVCTARGIVGSATDSSRGYLTVVIPMTRKGLIISDRRNVGPNKGFSTLLLVRPITGRSSLGHGTGDNLARGIVMSNSATGTIVEFESATFKTNAAIYRANKRMVDAASRYDSVDDAKAGLDAAWKVLEAQVENGSGYTPDSKLGFGSDNATVIAESLLGRRNSVGATRKSFNDLGR